MGVNEQKKEEIKKNEPVINEIKEQLDKIQNLLYGKQETRWEKITKYKQEAVKTDLIKIDEHESVVKKLEKQKLIKGKAEPEEIVKIKARIPKEFKKIDKLDELEKKLKITKQKLKKEIIRPVRGKNGKAKQDIIINELENDEITIKAQIFVHNRKNKEKSHIDSKNKEKSQIHSNNKIGELLELNPSIIKSQNQMAEIQEFMDKTKSTIQEGEAERAQWFGDDSINNITWLEEIKDQEEFEKQLENKRVEYSGMITAFDEQNKNKRNIR